MADKNLHDIKIDDLDNPKKTPLKNILTLLALLFIILVISVAITRLILNTDEEGLIDDNSSTAIVETNNENSSDATVATTAGVAAAALTGSMLANRTQLKERNVSTISSSADTSDDSRKDDSIKDKNSGSKTKVTLREHKPVRSREVVTPKKHTYIPKKHTVAKKSSNHSSDNKYIDKVVSSNRKTVSHSRSVEGKKRPGHYIKVGTFKDTSTAIAKIKKTGLNYILVKPKNDKTMTRVLIGPFKSNWGAKQHLPNVQHNIAEGAYITRID